MSLLTSTQLNVIGKDYSNDIYHKSYHHLISKPNKDDYYEDEEEQTYDEYVDMGKRNPNANGTGRWKLNNNRYKILLIYLYESMTPNMNLINDLKNFLKAYIQLDIEICILQTELDINKKQISINDNNININMINKDIYGTYPLKFLPITTKIKTKKSIRRAIEVFSLFDILTHFVKQPYITSVTLVEHSLAEQCDETVHEVLGRACGDRVCCVSVPNNESRELMGTTVHELLHTLGFDHCNSFKCVMNAIAAETSLHLSPPNLRKLMLFHGLYKSDRNRCRVTKAMSYSATEKTFMLTRYEELLKVLTSFSPELYEEDCLWLRQMISALKAIYPI